MNTLTVILPLLCLMEHSVTWAQTPQIYFPPIQYQQLGRSNYVRDYVNHIIYYPQPIVPQRRPEFLTNRIRDIDDDRVVFTETSQEDGESRSNGMSSDRRILPGQPARAPVAPSDQPAATPTAHAPRRENAEATTRRLSPEPAGNASVEDQSVNTIPSGPSRCIWAIVSCCTPHSSLVRHACFETLGCRGPFWDTNPCDGRVTQSAAKVALDFYATG